MREAVLTSLPEREVDFRMIRGDTTPESDKKWVLTDNYNPLNQWQRPSALRHWRSESIHLSHPPFVCYSWNR